MPTQQRLQGTAFINHSSGRPKHSCTEASQAGKQNSKEKPREIPERESRNISSPKQIYASYSSCVFSNIQNEKICAIKYKLKQQNTHMIVHSITHSFFLSPSLRSLHYFTGLEVVNSLFTQFFTLGFLSIPMHYIF